jgi:hypothetical protein
LVSSTKTTLKDLARHTGEVIVAAVAPATQIVAQLAPKPVADIVLVSERAPVELAARAVGYAQITGGQIHSIKDFVDEVLRASHGKPIRSLFIGAHGVAGSQNVGESGGGGSGGGVALHLAGVAGADAAELSRLKGHFAPGAVVTLGGCEVGLGLAGEMLEGELAKLWGVTVQASADEQYPEHGLEGTNIRVARPDPSLSKGYSVATQKDAVEVPGDAAGNVPRGSPLRVASDLIALSRKL